MTAAILPAGVSVKLVRLALKCEREAREWRAIGYHAHAAAAAREARECRDMIEAHEAALQARIAAAEARLTRPVDLRVVFPEANLEGVV